ncbi:hypothetical protein L1987_08805 [Smallanthus sonchifolius]|uniref:Uncharacterized protein n=1 Tax=Smallanthus sonchifolius TaxID=185202 RepID=A0ACB9JL69_9ASTR|nr:hypothetical protein L1987_08805 [Smallanthus sonchifolius]
MSGRQLANHLLRKALMMMEMHLVLETLIMQLSNSLYDGRVGDTPRGQLLWAIDRDLKFEGGTAMAGSALTWILKLLVVDIPRLLSESSDGSSVLL